MRNILYLGRYDKEKKKFTERTGGALSPFPDLNQEALNIVLDAFEEEGFDFGYDKSEDVKNRFNIARQNKNFKEMYQIAIEEFKPVPEELLQITEGEWRTFKRQSDPEELVNSLKDWGTGWCIRGRHMAKTYLVDNDSELQVYFTKDKDGNNKVPRVVTVVDRNGALQEVRGIAYQENLDPYIDKVVDTKLKEFPDGESFRKKQKDMKTLTEIYYKCFDKKTKNYLGAELTKEELRFLYEVDNKIEGFGYEDDPRIKEIMDKRVDVRGDLSKIFDCKKEDILVGFEESFNKKENQISVSIVNGKPKINESFVLESDMVNPHSILSPKSPTNTTAGIYNGPNFSSWLLPLVENKEIQINPKNIHSHTLDKNMKGQDILDSLIKAGRAKPFTLAEVSSILKNQSEISGNYPTNSSPLDTRNYNSNLFLVGKGNGELVFMGVSWNFGSRKWRLYTNDLSLEWNAGRCVFSQQQ